MIRELSNNGAMPSLERLVQFTEARQRILADNVANLSTPYHQARDLNVKNFQQTLGKAIDQRRQSNAPTDGPLNLRDTSDLAFDDHGLTATPETLDGSVMFHDHNNRDLERTMQGVAENVMAHQFGVTLLKNQFDLLRTAIRERL